VAKETITKLIDDLDGGEAHETVKFGLDGHSYEIDLSTKNANKLRNAMSPYLESGTRVSGRSTSAVGRAGARGRGGAVAERRIVFELLDADAPGNVPRRHVSRLGLPFDRSRPGPHVLVSQQ